MKDPGFKKDFELRRNIFGLSAIIKAPHDKMPKLINDKMPEIMQQLTSLVIKKHTNRIDELKENEIHIKNDGKKVGDPGFIHPPCGKSHGETKCTGENHVHEEDHNHNHDDHGN